MRQGFSARGLHPFPIRSLGGTADELSSPTELPEGNVIKSVNFRPHEDGISRVKRMGYSKFDAFYDFGGHRILGLFDYWDENLAKRYVLLTAQAVSNAAIWGRKSSDSSWTKLYEAPWGNTFEFPVKPVVYLRERPIVLGLDTNRLVEPTTTYGLGIEAPTTAPTLAEGAAGNLTGTFKGVVTYMRSGNFQVESNPSPESSPLTVSAKKINWSSIPVSSDPKVDKKRLYRTTAGGAIFFWVADIDNATTTYEDNITELGAEVSYDRYPPPIAVCAAIWDDRVWFVPKYYPNQLQFTNKHTSEEMANDNILQAKGKDSDEIMVIIVYKDSLYGLKRKSFFRVDKVGDSAYELTFLPYNTGTDAPASAAVGGGLLMWYSKRGIEVFNGETLFRPPISDRLRTTMATINEASIANAFGIVNEKWDEYWLSVPTGTSLDPDTVIVFDYLRGKISTHRFAKKLTAMHNLRDADAKLQFITGSSDGNLYVQDSGYTDDGELIQANFMTKQYCCLTNEKGKWNTLRRLFAEYICPSGSKVILNIYKNKQKFPIVSISLDGSTPSDEDVAREVVMRRCNLGISCAYFCLEFIHNEIADGEVRVLTPDIYFNRKVWKKDIEAD